MASTRTTTTAAEGGTFAAASLLCVALGNPSLAGSAFLLLFLVWALFCVPSSRTPRGAAVSRALWGAAAALSLFSFVLQLGVQLAYLLRTPGIRGRVVEKFLEVVGFSKVDSLGDAVLQVAPLVLALVATAHQVAAGGAAARARRRRRETGRGGEQETPTRTEGGPARRFSAAAAVAGVALAGAALSRPSLLAFPYLIAAAAALHRWSSGSNGTFRRAPSPSSYSFGTAGLGFLLAYSASHLAALYVWQWSLSYLSELEPLAELLGLFVLDSDELSSAEMAAGVALFGSLALLVAALGFCLRRWEEDHAGGTVAAVARGGLGLVARVLHADAAASTASNDERQSIADPEEHRGLREPLIMVQLEDSAAGTSSVPLLEEEETLAQRQSPAAGQQQQQRSHWTRAAIAAIQIAAEWCVGLWEAVFSRAGAVGAAYCAVSVTAPPSAAGGLVLLFGVAALQMRPLGALSRGASRVALWGLSLWLVACYLATALHAALGRSALAEALGAHAFASGGPLLEIAAVAGAMAAHLRSSSGTFLSSLPMRGTLMQYRFIQALYTLALLGLPAATFAVGAARYTALHVALLGSLLAFLLRPTLRLKPSASLAAARETHRRRLRMYVGLVLVAMYAVNVGGLKVFGNVLQPDEAEAALKVLGLWRPSVQDMLPFMALLALAALQAALSQAAGDPSWLAPPIAGQPPTVDGVSTWRPSWLLRLARKDAVYGAPALSAAIYCILLLNCDVAAVGLAYLALAVWCLAVQPRKGRWVERSGEAWRLNQLALGAYPAGGIAPACQVILVSTPARRWLPLATAAAFAALDLVAQALLPAAAATAWPAPIPPEILLFLRDFVGVDAAAEGRGLALRLLRPVVVLGVIVMYRHLYCIGTLHRQLQHDAMADGQYERHRLAKQWGVVAAAKRFAVLHTSKALAVLAFVAAMQTPSALGWALVVGIVLSAPLLSMATPLTAHRTAACDAVLFLAHSMVTVWLLAQYALQIPLVSAQLGSSAAALAAWVGLDAGGAPASPSRLEYMMRYKAILLGALALKQKALVWWSKLPAVVRESAQGGDACPLFWPPGPGHVAPSTVFAATGEEEQQQVEEDAPQQPLSAAAKEAWHSVTQRALELAQQALQAVDWPAPRAAPAPAAQEEAQVGVGTSKQEGQEEGGRAAEVEKEEEYATPGKLLLHRGHQGSSDSFYTPRKELVFLSETTPTVAATTAAAAAAAAAAAVPDQQREASPRPNGPPISSAPAAAVTSEAGQCSQLAAFRFAVQDWLERWFDEWGLEVAMFALLIAAFTAANALSLGILVAVGVGMAAPPTARQWAWKAAVVPALGAVLVWQYSELLGLPPPLDNRFGFYLAADVKTWLGLQEVDPATVWALFFAFCASVLQLRHDKLRREAAAAAEDQPSLTAPLLGTAQMRSRASLGGRPSPTLAETAPVWAPLRHSAQSCWRWHDWVRYRVYRHSLDFLLIAVVALCTMDNDIIHAGYLALALFFFRSRVALRARRNSLFAWLPAYNFAVMVVVLAYQAPFEDVWDWPLDDGKRCTLAHLLGLYKLRSTSTPPDPDRPLSLLSWGYEGAAADLVLWAFIRLQTHMFASPAYSQAVQVAEKEEELQRAARKAEVIAWKDAQAAAALEESRQRAARALRISRIKADVDRSLSRFGVGVNPTVLDFAFLAEGAGTRGQEGSAAAPAVGTAFGPDDEVDHLRWPESPVREGGSTSSGGGFSRRGSSALRSRRRQDTAQEGGSPSEQAPVASRIGEWAAGEEEEGMPRNKTVHDTIASKSIHAAATEQPASTASSSSAAHDSGVRQQQQQQHGWSAIFRWVLSTFPRRTDRRESALAYALFIFAYLSDLSLLTLALPLSAFLYALVAVRPARAYWLAVLVYCEALIVASYAFQVPSRLDCGFISPRLERIAAMLGVHSTASLGIPIFLVYLATLRHTHGLITRHAAGQRAAAAANAASFEGGGGVSPFPRPSIKDLEAGEGGGEEAEDEEEAEGEGDGSWGQEEGQERRPEVTTVTVGSVVTSTMNRSVEAGLGLAAAAWEFGVTACTSCERPPAFLLVKVRCGAGAQRLKTDGAALEQALQGHLNAARAADLRRERLKQRRSESSLSLAGEGLWQEPAFGRGGMYHHHHHHAPSGSIDATEDETASSRPNLASVGPLQLRLHSFVAPSSATGPSLSSAQRENQPHVSSDDICALIEVVALPSTPENSPGVCVTPGWPLRSLRPAALAAEVLQSKDHREDVAEVQVLVAEPHGRQARDFYAATAALDILAFIFVAVYFNRVVQAAGSISEITSLHVVPLGYLLTLMTLFMFIVMDRVVYTLGSPAGKAVLHITEMALFFWYCSSLVWGEFATSPAPRTHLRLLLALKALSFTLSSLQLRTGYPPPASYANGMGRHTFVFMRSLSLPASIASHVFVAVPFLYEMRQLLDWACTPTTLTLYDWLKLEDVNLSLYHSAVMQESKKGRTLGTRQPRYLKFFQGTLLFTLLLVLLWVPLLVFSTGNPTYQVPAVAAFSVNVTLQASGPPYLGLATGRVSAPLFSTASRTVWVPWVPPNASLPAALAPDYVPEQLQLMCTPPDADALWLASPPSKRALQDALEDPDADVALSIGVHVLRDLPPPSDHGGPMCVGSAAIELAWESRQGLLRVLRGEDDASVPLLRSLGDDEGGGENKGGGKGGNSNVSAALVPAFWMLRGDACGARSLTKKDFREAEGLPGRRTPPDLSWTNRWMACNVSLRTTSSGTLPAAKYEEKSGGNRIQMSATDSGGGMSWWRLQCEEVLDTGEPAPLEEWASCSSRLSGPFAVAVLDRVQGGIIGATLNKFGVIGLYTVFVYGIGRALRFSVTNLRMRIPFEDLPTTRRLVALVADIYIARAEGLLALEEELYAALLAVYRLPAVLFELTKKEK